MRDSMNVIRQSVGSGENAVEYRAGNCKHWCGDGKPSTLAHVYAVWLGRRKINKSILRLELAGSPGQTFKETWLRQQGTSC